jgi:hypothetical protein
VSTSGIRGHAHPGIHGQDEADQDHATVKKELLLHFRMTKGFSLLPNKISSLLKYLSPGIEVFVDSMTKKSQKVGTF